MFKTVLFAAVAATCSLAATPSLAAPTGAAILPAEGAVAMSQPAPSKAPARARETIYCVIGTVTGSRIRQKECHTRAEWIDLTGNDPLEKN